MLAGIIFILIIILFSIAISFIIPIYFTTKIFNFQLTKKEYFHYYIYILLFPISILFSRVYYNQLLKKNIIQTKLGFCKIISTALILSFLFSTVITHGIVRYYLVKPFQSIGASMHPTVYDKEFLFTSKVLSTNKRGDIVVYTPNTNDFRKYFIGRIIGLPGETIKIENGFVWLKENGSYSQLTENYLNDESKGFTYVNDSENEMIYHIPENSFFILGDNRKYSTDSRDCFSICTNNSYFIGKSDIIGKYFFDLGYFNIYKFNFSHPNLGIETKPKFFKIEKKTQ